MKTDSQSSLAYHDLRRKILSAQLTPGTRLKEDFWAEKTGVGRMAVREALTRLLGEGLVQTGERGGYFVAEMTAEDVHQIRELREVLELAAVRLAAGRITEAQLNELQQICEEYTQMVQRGYLAGAGEADLKFHETLLNASGNSRLVRAYHHAHIPLFHQKLGRSRSQLNDYEQTDQEHRRILEALRTNDLPLVEQTLRAHFKRGEAAVLDF